MPRNARRTRPSTISAARIRRVASSIGTARPSPMPATAVLIPTTRPRESASAPPELPGLSAASVWMTFSTSRVARPSRVASERPSALTTPAVTVPANPSGLPIATTSWPTRSRAASPNGAGGGLAAARPDDRQVGQRIATDDPERELGAVDERGGSPVRARDHVGGRHEIAVGSRWPPPSPPPPDQPPAGASRAGSRRTGSAARRRR